MTDKKYPIEKAHDRFFKQAMAQKRVAREFFEKHLPADLLSITNLNKLELQPTSFIDDQRKESIADMLFKTDIQGHEAYLYILVDHQSTPDQLMPFRIFRYLYNIITKYLNEKKGKKIPLIYPLVVYHGTQPWRYSTDINSLVDAPPELVEAYFLKPFNLIDLNHIEDTVLKEKAWSGVMELTLKYILARDMQPYLKDIIDLLKQVERSDGKEFAKIVLTYILDRGELGNKDIFLNSVETELSSELGETIMTIAEQLKAEGIEKGLERGIEKRNIEIAERLLSEKADPTFVARVTGLSLAKVKEIHDKRRTT